MVQFLQKVNPRDSQVKNLIIKAWRERWSDIQWGIHSRVLFEGVTDTSFIADAILQQALNGPGPNSLVFSYLMHSIYSQMVPASAVLKSVSQYDGYHKPFCIASLLDLLENIKERVIPNQREGGNQSLDLALAIESVVHWLLTCMYSSLEILSDLSSDFPAEIEDSKIVTKCRKLLEYFLRDQFLYALLHVAIHEDPTLYDKIKRMIKEIGKFSNGHHGTDINQITILVNKLKNFREDLPGLKKHLNSPDGLKINGLNGSIQAMMMTAALLRPSSNVNNILNDLVVVKQIKNLPNSEIFCEIIHSTMLGLVDSIGKEHELKFIGFAFLQLPLILQQLKEKINDNGEGVLMGLEMFISNESTLEVIDAKLHCYTFDLFLGSLAKNGLIMESHKKALLAKKPSNVPSSKQNSSNAVLMLKAESTLMSVLKTLDGDYGKNQDAIQGVLCDMLGKSFDLILTAASATGRLQQLATRLIKLNQFSRQVNGEGSKASATRAMIFDISFLMLCHTFQIYEKKTFDTDEPDCFFEEFYRECMVEGNVAKNPDSIFARCDQNKVDLLLNQYLQGDTELKTSLVFWHELCTNSIGVVRELLLAWNNDSVNFPEVKKLLDVFRSRICSLPICISSWLCAYIQMMPEDQCGKARYILNHFLNPITSDDAQDNLKERSALMCSIINKMMNCIQPVSSSPAVQCISERKPATTLYKNCWECMGVRGVIDVDSTTAVNNLMNISGHTRFVQICIQEMIRIQDANGLSQWADLAYGLFHIDIKSCTKALINKVLPFILHFSTTESNFVEPKINFLVSLAVSCILSWYYHIKISDGDVKNEIGEPSTKRRKLSESLVNKENTSELEIVLKEFYQDFEKILSSKSEARPQVVFILRFLEELVIRTPTLTLLHSIPNKIIKELIFLMNNEMDTKFLLGVHLMTDKAGRTNCSDAICDLKNLQNKYLGSHSQNPLSS